MKLALSGTAVSFLYFFFTAANKAMFEKSPEIYARPNYDMIEVPGMPAAQ